MGFKWIALCLSVMAAAGAHAVTLFSPDEFDTGNEGWFGGFGHGTLPGGPNGASDNFLQVQGIGGTGPGSRPGAYNDDARFTGNYTAAGATGIRLWLRNTGASDMAIRLVLFDINGSRWTSNNAVHLGVGGAWSRHTFGVSNAELTRVLGTSSYSDTLTGVTRVMLRHQVGAPESGGTVSTGSFGMDKVEVVPEPATAAALGLGLLALRRRRALGTL